MQNLRLFFTAPLHRNCVFYKKCDGKRHKNTVTTPSSAKMYADECCFVFHDLLEQPTTVLIDP